MCMINLWRNIGIWCGSPQYDHVTMYELDDLECIKANIGHVWYVHEVKWRQKSLGSSYSALSAHAAILYEVK